MRTARAVGRSRERSKTFTPGATFTRRRQWGELPAHWQSEALALLDFWRADRTTGDVIVSIVTLVSVLLNIAYTARELFRSRNTHSERVVR
jgi:hypothetical protein